MTVVDNHTQIGLLTYQDITSQPKVLEILVEELFSRSEDILRIIRNYQGTWVFTGCGTTYALGISAAACFRHQGFSAMALPASELKFYPESLPQSPTILAVVSRSGETSETLWAVETFREQRPHSPIIAITASPQSHLTGLADWVLDASVAQDHSVVETVSYTGMLFVAQILSAFLSNDQTRLAALKIIPKLISELLPLSKKVAETILQSPINRFFFLGGGSYYGIACQSSFTIKEFSGSWAEAYHPLEFRHGPRTAATSGSLVVLFLSDNYAVEELDVLKDMHEQGARALVILDNKHRYRIPALDYILELNSGLDEWDRLILHMPFVHWLAYYYALSVGKDPDHPANLQAVTRLI